MATFHTFCRLPKELRLLIWELTVEPRIVDVHACFIERHHARLRVLSSSIPVPAQLQVCRESRNAGLYQPSFSTVTVFEGKAEKSDERYIWLNLDMDMIFIHSNLEVLKPVAHSIKRLRFTACNYFDPWWNGREWEELPNFINALEIHVVVDERDTFRDWYRASETYYWPCGVENVLMIDPKEGEELKLMDLEFRYDQLVEEYS